MGGDKRLLTICGAIAGAAAMALAAATAIAGDTNTRADASIVLAQAGSTGGTIGKRDKSVSGGEEPAMERKPSSPKSRPVRVISGTWNWNANCETIGPQVAGFVLNQVSPTSFNGRFVTTGAQLSWGTIVNGALSGDRLSFDRVGHPLGWREHWKARLIGEGNSTKMEGSTTGTAQCTFTANR
jgi:hypothetical protein